jgi:RNA polymerase sigma factor (sigma-70 family)
MDARVELDEAGVAPGRRGLDLASLDDALTALASKDPQLGRIVELKFFGGLTTAEIAEVLGVSVATVEREWAAARAWLRREMAGSP